MLITSLIYVFCSIIILKFCLLDGRQLLIVIFTVTGCANRKDSKESLDYTLLQYIFFVLFFKLSFSTGSITAAYVLTIIRTKLRIVAVGKKSQYCCESATSNDTLYRLIINVVSISNAITTKKCSDEPFVKI